MFYYSSSYAQVTKLRSLNSHSYVLIDGEACDACIWWWSMCLMPFTTMCCPRPISSHITIYFIHRKPHIGTIAATRRSPIRANPSNAYPNVSSSIQILNLSLCLALNAMSLRKSFQKISILTKKWAQGWYKSLTIMLWEKWRALGIITSSLSCVDRTFFLLSLLLSISWQWLVLSDQKRPTVMITIIVKPSPQINWLRGP